jgi:membrane associated rhomboid family serine protease
MWNIQDDIKSLDKQNFYSSLFFPLLFLVTIWMVKIWEEVMGVSFSHYGVFPRTAEGLIGIALYPLIHGDWNHLINNSTAMLLLSLGIFYFYRPVAYRIYFWTYLMSGIWIWASARANFHIGSSGLIYGFAAFIFFSGIIRKNTNLLALSMLVTFLYGGMVWGIFPIRPEMSYEGHLWGAVAGLILAIYFRKEGPQKRKYSWELEEEEDKRRMDEMEKTKEVQENDEIEITKTRPLNPFTNQPGITYTYKKKDRDDEDVD